MEYVLRLLFTIVAFKIKILFPVKLGLIGLLFFVIFLLRAESLVLSVMMAKQR